MVANRGHVGGALNTDPWTSDPLMPLTARVDLEGEPTVNTTTSANYNQLSSSNLPLVAATLQVAGDRVMQPETKTPAPEGQVVVSESADSVTLPQGVYKCELYANLDVSASGGQYKLAVTGTGTGGNTHIHSWRSSQRIDAFGVGADVGWAGAQTGRRLAKFTCFFDTGEWILGTVHAGMDMGDVVFARPRMKQLAAVARFVDNDAGSAGTAILREGSYLVYTRLCNTGGLSKADPLA